MTSKLNREPLFAEVHNVPDDYHFTAEELDRIIAGDLFTPRQGAIMARELQERRKAERDSEPVAVIDQANLDYLRSGADADVWPPEREEMGDVLLYRHAQPATVTQQEQMFGIGSIFKPQQVSEQEADCDGCVHYQPQICHGEGCPAISEKPAQPAPVVPEGLNPETTDLVLRFAGALADKLYKAEQKYGRSTDWMKDDWYDDCLQSLWEHIEKGDPRDVAAYCAFMWYHGWVTTDYDRNVQNACRAAMLQAGNSPVIPDRWIPVSERVPEKNQNILISVNFDSTLVTPLICTARYTGSTFRRGGATVKPGTGIEEVTHWMPLPEPPQEVNHERP